MIDPTNSVVLRTADPSGGQLSDSGGQCQLCFSGRYHVFVVVVAVVYHVVVVVYHVTIVASGHVKFLPAVIVCVLSTKGISY